MLRNRIFLTATFVMTVVMLTQNMLGFALPLLALEISGQGSDLALIKGAGFIPNILFAIFVGVINDRMRKAFGFRLYTSLLTGACALLTVSLLGGTPSVFGMAVFMILLGALGYALGNLHMTLIRLVVAEDHLPSAISLGSALNAIITTIGPAVAGFALLWFGYAGLTLVITCIMVLATCATFTIYPAESLPAKRPFWPALREGWQVFIANRELVMMTVVIVLTNAAEGAFGVALILKLKAGLFLTEAEIGLVLAAAGIGAVLGASLAPKLRKIAGYRAAFFWPIWALSAVYLAVAATKSVPLIYVLSFLEGALSLFFAIGVWSYRQETTAAAHMGRVAGLTGAIFKLLMPPVIILAGVLADADAVAHVFALAAGINAVAALFLVFVARWGLPRIA